MQQQPTNPGNRPKKSSLWSEIADSWRDLFRSLRHPVCSLRMWWTETCEQASRRQRTVREVWPIFLHSRLWRWLPLLLAAAFGLLFVLFAVIGGEPAGRALVLAGLFTGVIAFAWITGIWAAATPDEPDEPDGDTEEFAWLQRAPRWVRRLLLVLILLVLLGLFGWPQWRALLTGDEPLFKIFLGIGIKVVIVLLTLLPSWIARRR